MIEHEQIQSLLGLTQTKAMARALRKAGVPFRQTGGRLWTTEDAVTATLVGRGKTQKREEPDYDAAFTAERKDQARQLPSGIRRTMEEVEQGKRGRIRLVRGPVTSIRPEAREHDQ